MLGLLLRVFTMWTRLIASCPALILNMENLNEVNDLYKILHFFNSFFTLFNLAWKQNMWRNPRLQNPEQDPRFIWLLSDLACFKNRFVTSFVHKTR